MMMVATFARFAASTFSLIPPTGRILPVSVISPVMATSRRAGRLVKQRQERHGDRDACRRTVLLDGAARHMDMDVLALEEVLVDPEGGGAAPDIAQRGLHRFAHHLAEGTGDDQLLVALHPGRFDENDVTAGPGPDQAGRDADPVLLLDDLELILPSCPESARPVRA